ncbi:MAG: radical SAM protein [Chloroflexi bacterium]|nr:radical SAM protein [Chloroflexota bacterium]
MNWDAIGETRRKLSQETGAIVKDWGGRLPFALVYPNSYYLGMSNLGVHALYSLLNSQGRIVCERVFWENEGTAISLESQRPLPHFAVIAFSVSYELDYFSIALILKSSGIPVYAADRDESHPLVIAGGPCVTANPMPIAPFFDCVCIGEAEPILPAMLPLLAEGLGGSREELLKALGELPGVYVPKYPPKDRVARQWAKDLDEFPVHSVVLTPETELGHLYLIEIERGCPWRCRFCLVSSAFRPIRFRSLANIVEQARTGMQHRKRLGLVGPTVSDYPGFVELLERLKGLGAEVSVSSLRIKPLPKVLLGELARGQAKTVVLAPEAGSERLRRVIRKGITEDDVMAAVEKVAAQGIRQLKLYLMIGLPTETDEDIEAIIKLTLKCRDIMESQIPGSRIVLSVSPFVPKAGTPFQWMPMEQLAVLERRLGLLKTQLERRGVQVKGESPAWSEVQAVLARGDSSLAAVLATMSKTSLSEWRRALKTHGVDADYYAHQKWDTSKKLPWAVVDPGVKLSELQAELGRAVG